MKAGAYTDLASATGWASQRRGGLVHERGHPGHMDHNIRWTRFRPDGVGADRVSG